MKKLVTLLTLSLLINSESIAQNVAPKNQAKAGATATAPNASAPGISPEELKKRVEETKQFDEAVKNLSPENKQKFNKINADFSEKMLKLYTKLEQEVSKVSSLKNIMNLQDHIFSKKSTNGRTMPESMKKSYNAQISEFNKLDKDKKKAIKAEIIKFRKELLALQKERRQQTKELFGKEYSHFNETEKQEEIAKDEAL